LTPGAAFAPLAGIRVLDLTTSVAGPYCTLILASLGADVVKLERPDRGDDTRAWGPPFWNGESATFLALNAGKRSVALDLKTDEGREAARTLARGADVFVQNLRPGLADRLGLGFGDLAEEQDRLVYCSIGAFGRRGPLRDEPGYDPLMQAAAGLMSITGEPGGRPVRAGPSIVDQGTGMWSAIAILGALRARDAGAGAQLIDTSLYEVALNWVPYQLVRVLATGRAPGPMGSGIGILAPYQAFRTSDGWLMVAAGNDRLFASLCGCLDVPELADDARFRTNADRVEHRQELAYLLGERLRSGTSATWEAQIRQAGVPVAPIRDLAEVSQDVQTAALEIFPEIPHPLIPDLRVVAPPISVDDERLGFTGPPPRLGEHTAAVLREAGYDEDRIARILDAGAVRD
jgi:crotonobetainyl-CoA:carnitine CoA-transferase CaiB-like acyl-CoA transferase